MATAQNHALQVIDLTAPHHDKSILALAGALHVQWINGEPADWSMVSEVLHRAIQTESSAAESSRKSATAERSDVICTVYEGTMLECPRCGHTGCNNAGTGAYRPYPCQNRIDLGSNRKRSCDVCGCDALHPA